MNLETKIIKPKLGLLVQHLAIQQFLEMTRK